MKKNCENCAYNDNSSRLPPCLGCTASTTNPVPSNWEAGANYVPDIKTNADRIRGMSDEELAVLFGRLCHNAACCDDCPLDEFCPENEQTESWERMLSEPCKEEE